MAGGDVLLIRDVAPDLGLSPDAIRQALRRAPGRFTVRVGPRVAIRFADLEWFVARRERFAPLVARRPKGWPTVDGVADVLGVDPTHVHRMMVSGRLRAVRHKKTLFYDPDTVEAERLRRARLLPGWVTLAELRAAHGWHEVAAYRTAKRMGLELREFHIRHDGTIGTGRRLAVREEDAAKIIERIQGRALTVPGHLLSTELAAILGLKSSKGLQAWARRGCPHVRAGRGHLHFRPRAVIAYLTAGKPTKLQQQQAERLREYMRGPEWKKKRREWKQQSTASKPSSTPSSGSGQAET